MKNELPEELYQLRSQIKSTPKVKPKLELPSLTHAEIEEVLDSIDWKDKEPSWPQTPRYRAIVFLRYWLRAIDYWLWNRLSINRRAK
ncbi:MAG: hypothetical protein ACRCT2_13895 [Plesiomonas shigelloides]